MKFFLRDSFSIVVGNFVTHFQSLLGTRNTPRNSESIFFISSPSTMMRSLVFARLRSQLRVSRTLQAPLRLHAFSTEVKDGSLIEKVMVSQTKNATEKPAGKNNVGVTSTVVSTRAAFLFVLAFDGSSHICRFRHSIWYLLL
jgi:hypothetical protein